MDVTAVAIVGMIFVVFPAVIAHYLVRWRETKGLSSDDERMLEDLWRAAQRMEKRIETLETILDDQAPGWRSDERATEEPPLRRTSVGRG